MSDFVEYKPMDVEHNVKAAVENLRKAYLSNDAEKVAKIFTEAEGIIVSAICHDTYTVCKPDEEKTQGDLIRRSDVMKLIPKVIGGQNEFADCIRDSVKQVIDNAPIVPQGEWIIVKDEKFGDNVKCPFCGKELAGTDLNFCCKCGAKLIGSEKMNGGAE